MARLEFIRKSQRLLTRIEAHEQKAVEFLVGNNRADENEEEDNDNILAEFDDNTGAEWDDLDGLSIDPGVIGHLNTHGDDIPAYKIGVILPSSFPEVESNRRGLQALRRQELELRQGQAEDKLSELRTLLAWKSVSFRRNVRQAEVYRARTRAWGDIKAIASGVRASARAYEQARKMICLLSDANSEEGQALRSRFRILTLADLKISTEFLDSSARGNRNTPQSWIWSMNVAGDIEGDEWLHECK